MSPWPFFRSFLAILLAAGLLALALGKCEAAVLSALLPL